MLILHIDFTSKMKTCPIRGDHWGQNKHVLGIGAKRMNLLWAAEKCVSTPYGRFLSSLIKQPWKCFQMGSQRFQEWLPDHTASVWGILACVLHGKSCCYCQPDPFVSRDKTEGRYAKSCTPLVFLCLSASDISSIFSLHPCLNQQLIWL